MYGIKVETWACIIRVFKQYDEVEDVILYGSRAKGTFKNGSDIDLCFKGKGLKTEILLEIMDKIDELYLPYEFDLSIYDQIENVELIDHINRVGISLYNLER